MRKRQNLKYLLFFIFYSLKEKLKKIRNKVKSGLTVEEIISLFFICMFSFFLVLTVVIGGRLLYLKLNHISPNKLIKGGFGKWQA